MSKATNQRPALDAAITFSSHFGCHQRGASEAERWAVLNAVSKFSVY
jgi:hypothetical protein